VPEAPHFQQKANADAEIKRLQKDLKRVTEERDILKKPRRTSPVNPSEVRLYQAIPAYMASQEIMSAAGCSPQWFLVLAQNTQIKPGDS
jgi:hypothetical protein